MAANTSPIFTRAPNVQGVESVTVANNLANITSGTVYLVYTADATEGSLIDYIRLKPNPANNTAATSVRYWINNGLTLGTAANSWIFGEQPIPATTASATNAQVDFTYVMQLRLNPGYRVYAQVATAPGGSGAFTITGIGGPY